MKYCQNCGKEIDERAVVCPHCGVPVNGTLMATSQNDTGSIGWGVLGFFVPLVGLILYLVWKNDKPKNAKSAGIGALVLVGVWAAFIVIGLIMGIVAGASGY